MATILVVEDEQVLARNICDAMEFAGHDASAVRTGEEALVQVDKNMPDIIVLDYRLPGMDGLGVLRALRDAGHHASVIFMTAHGSIDVAVTAMKTGAGDFLTKPLDLKQLQLTVDRELQHRRTAEALRYFQDRERALSERAPIIGESKPMQEVKRFISRLAGSAALSSENPPSVLVTGETGTGKDLVARAIHYSGPRHDDPFVQVNCTALPDHLVEAELFGHVKGAFTDARGDKRGLLECADGGTVFLDEIGHMKPALQAKLLQVLEQRLIRPVGGTKERRINVHFIAATNRNLEEAIQEGEFRDDLFHRLRNVAVHLAPLKERSDDVELLAVHFLAVHSARFGIRVERFSPAAMRALHEYNWPGNVRELAHVMESAVLFADGPVIGVEHLNIRTVPKEGRTLDVELPGAQSISLDFADSCPKLEEIEYTIIKAALEYSKHNLSRAARILGISRDAVRYRIERFENRQNDEDEPHGPD